MIYKKKKLDATPELLPLAEKISKQTKCDLVIIGAYENTFSFTLRNGIGLVKNPDLSNLPEVSKIKGEFVASLPDDTAEQVTPKEKEEAPKEGEEAAQKGQKSGRKNTQKRT